MRKSYHSRAPYREEELEAAEELVPDPFSEEPHTRPHIRRRLAGAYRRAPGGEAAERKNTSGDENS